MNPNKTERNKFLDKLHNLIGSGSLDELQKAFDSSTYTLSVYELADLMFSAAAAILGKPGAQQSGIVRYLIDQIKSDDGPDQSRIFSVLTYRSQGGPCCLSAIIESCDLETAELCLAPLVLSDKNEENQKKNKKYWEDALLSAVQNKYHHQVIVKYLLQIKPDISLTTDRDGNTALHWAAKKCDLATVQQLFNIQRDQKEIEAKNNDAETILHYASENSDPQVLVYIFNKYKFESSQITAVDKSGNNVLHYAVYKPEGSLEKVKFWIGVFTQHDKKYLIWKRNKKGETPLLMARCYLGKRDNETARSLADIYKENGEKEPSKEDEEKKSCEIASEKMMQKFAQQILNLTHQSPPVIPAKKQQQQVKTHPGDKKNDMPRKVTQVQPQTVANAAATHVPIIAPIARRPQRELNAKQSPAVAALLPATKVEPKVEKREGKPKKVVPSVSVPVRTPLQINYEKLKAFLTSNQNEAKELESLSGEYYKSFNEDKSEKNAPYFRLHSDLLKTIADRYFVFNDFKNAKPWYDRARDFRKKNILENKQKPEDAEFLTQITTKIRKIAVTEALQKKQQEEKDKQEKEQRQKNEEKKKLEEKERQKKEQEDQEEQKRQQQLPQPSGELVAAKPAEPQQPDKQPDKQPDPPPVMEQPLSPQAPPQDQADADSVAPMSDPDLTPISTTSTESTFSRSSMASSVPDDNLDLVERAWALERAGKIAEAMPLYQQAIGQNSPNAALAANNLGCYYEGNGEIEIARPFYLKAWQLGDSNGAVSLGISFFVAGNYKNAVDWWQAASEESLNPYALCLISDSLQKQLYFYSHLSVSQNQALATTLKNQAETILRRWSAVGDPMALVYLDKYFPTPVILHEGSAPLPDSVKATMEKLGPTTVLGGSGVRHYCCGGTPRDNDVYTETKEVQKALPTATQNTKITNFTVYKYTEDKYIFDIVQCDLSALQELANKSDFTVNALYERTDEKIIDPTGRGLLHLRAGIIDTVIEPKESFTADIRRVLRALCLSNEEYQPGKRYMFSTRVLAAAKEISCSPKVSELLDQVKPGDLYHVICKCFMNGHAEENFNTLMEWGLWDKLFPVNVAQRQEEKYKIFLQNRFKLLDAKTRIERISPSDFLNPIVAIALGKGGIDQTKFVEILKPYRLPVEIMGMMNGCLHKINQINKEYYDLPVHVSKFAMNSFPRFIPASGTKATTEPKVSAATPPNSQAPSPK